MNNSIPIIIKRNEWIFVSIVSFFIIILTISPYIYGYLTGTKDRRFMGMSQIINNDTYSYIAWIQQAREGHLLFNNLFSIEKQNPILFHPLFLVMGIIGRLTNLSNILVYHLFRLLLGLVFLLLSYRLIAVFFSESFQRKTCFLLLAVSSGLGFMKLAPNLSWDTWVPESNSFLSLYVSPLNLLSLILVISFFIFFFKYLITNYNKYSVLCGFILFLLALTHPYELLSIFTIVSLFVFSQLFFNRDDLFSVIKLHIRFITVNLLILTPGLIYIFFVIKSPIYSEWILHNNTPIISIVGFLSGFGILLLLSFFGLLKLKITDQKNALIISWIISNFVLIFQSWFLFQRKFSLGLQIPLAILATIGVFVIIKKDSLNRQKLNVIVLILLSFITNILVLVHDIKIFTTKETPYYFNNSYITSFDWLQKNASENDIVLSGYWTSNIIPGMTGLKVYYGHYDQTYHAWDKFRAARKFFKDKESPNLKYEFLVKNSIKYIIFGEVELGMEYENIRNYIFLKPVYSNGGTTVYQVMTD